MSVKTNTTKAENISTTVRSIDFVTSFGNNWKALMNVLGISRGIEKVPGQGLKVVTASMTLESGSVAEGDEIPYSAANVSEVTIGEATIEKYGKGVTIEAINKYGYDVAIEKTDAEFLVQLQKKVTNKFYTFLNTGSLTAIDTTFQMALAMAKARCLAAFQAMDKDCTDVVGFVNTLDFYEYLGGASVTTQTAFGQTYVQGFLGYNVIFLLDSDRIARGRIIATPTDNVVYYYINPATSDFAKAGLEFTVDGETPLIGFHSEGNYKTLVSENTAIMGLYLFAEYLNAICVEKIEASGTIGSLTVASVAGTATGDSKLTVTESLGQGCSFYYKAQASTAPTVAYKDTLDSTWTAMESGKDYTLTSGHKITIAEVNGAGQVVASGNTTVVVKA